MVELRSVFLYSVDLTKTKQIKIKKAQKEYTHLINQMIEIMIRDENYYLSLLTNNSSSPEISSLEKSLRSSYDLGSAYGQEAMIQATKETFNHFTRIKKSIYQYCIRKMPDLMVYLNSTAVFNCCITDSDEKNILNDLIAKQKANKKPDLDKINFYQKELDEIDALNPAQNQQNKELVKNLFLEQVESRKNPFVTKNPLQLDARLCNLEKATKIKQDYVLSVKLSSERGKVEIPFKTSSNGLRRLNQYKNCSPKLQLVGNQAKLTIPIKKKSKVKKTVDYLGTDTGITDLFNCSDGTKYSTFSGMRDHYEQWVEKKTKKRSKIRSKKKEYQKKLKYHKNELTEEQKQRLRTKIFRLSQMLIGKNNLRKCQNKYNHEVNKRIYFAYKELAKHAKENHLHVVVEDLEILNFDRGKKNNKRDSMWVRGKLLTKLKERLTWNGVPVTEVEPAYTSQVCPHCHNLNSENRDGKSFVCTVCGHSDDADHNASVNIKLRATDEEIKSIVEKYRYLKNKRHKELRILYAQRHQAWLDGIKIS